LSELKWDPRVTAAQIEVSVAHGIVTLRGNVTHYSEKSNSEQIAQGVRGVLAVVDEIAVKLMGSYNRTDGDIAQAALNALDWNFSVPKNIKLIVEKGCVTLQGEVEWNYQRDDAENAVANLLDVCGVKNEITLKWK
jgi:osmotically-inducible protein OsmY